MADPAPSDPRLVRLIGGAPRAELRQRLRRIIARGAAGAIRLDRLSEADHAVLAALLGRPARPTSSMTVDLSAIDAAFARAGIATSLRNALERLDGPIIDRKAAERERELQWAEVFERAGHPSLRRLFADGGRGAGRRLLRRLAGLAPAEGSRLCEQAATVLERLPASGVPRSRLSALALGDAHALDDGRPVATLVLAAWRAAREVAAPMDAEGPDDVAVDGASDLASDPETDPLPGDGADRDDADPDPAGSENERSRHVWAEAGVLVNELARPVLVLNLPWADDGTPSFAAGEPGYLSLRRLARTPPAWRVSGRTVFVCENPNIVAWAAHRLGTACAPLVSTDGMPAAAQRTLLAGLVAAGARLRYHGDFDWPGIRIANAVMRQHGATPWRMGATDYREAIDAAAGERHRLDGAPVAATWDPALCAAMAQAGVAIAEESVADALLEDLAAQTDSD